MARSFYKQNKFLIYSYSLFILIFLAFSFYFYVNEKKNENVKNSQYLRSLAKLKSDEITQWYSERLFDALSFYSNELLREKLIDYSKYPSPADSMKIVSSIRQTYQNTDYKNIFILNKNYKDVINLHPTSDTEYEIDSVVSAIDKNKIVFSNFYRNSSNSNVDIDIYIPIKNGNNL